jgi:hypothetical protein
MTLLDADASDAGARTTWLPVLNCDIERARCMVMAFESSNGSTAELKSLAAASRDGGERRGGGDATSRLHEEACMVELTPRHRVQHHTVS